MQDQITADHSHLPEALTENAHRASRMGNAPNEAMEAATQALERQEEAKRLCETVYNEAIKSTLEKTEVLEKRVKTVTQRAEPLATTEADFFKTLPDRQQETQKHLHDIPSQFCQTRSSVRNAPRKTHSHAPA